MQKTYIFLKFSVDLHMAIKNKENYPFSSKIIKQKIAKTFFNKVAVFMVFVVCFYIKSLSHKNKDNFTEKECHKFIKILKCFL